MQLFMIEISLKKWDLDLWVAHVIHLAHLYQSHQLVEMMNDAEAPGKIHKQQISS